MYKMLGLSFAVHLHSVLLQVHGIHAILVLLKAPMLYKPHATVTCLLSRVCVMQSVLNNLTQLGMKYYLQRLVWEKCFTLLQSKALWMSLGPPWALLSNGMQYHLKSWIKLITYWNSQHGHKHYDHQLCEGLDDCIFAIIFNKVLVIMTHLLLKLAKTTWNKSPTKFKKPSPTFRET